MNDFRINFQDTTTAFADKSDNELKEKFWLFKMMNFAPFVNLGTKLTDFAFSVNLPIKGLVKRTIFRQFCGGETIEECQPTIEKLGASRIGTILDYSIEGKLSEAVFESTKNEIIRTITRAKADEAVPFAVFKTTGVARFDILEKINAGRDLLKGAAADWGRARAR